MRILVAVGLAVLLICSCRSEPQRQLPGEPRSYIEEMLEKAKVQGTLATMRRVADASRRQRMSVAVWPETILQCDSPLKMRSALVDDWGYGLVYERFDHRLGYGAVKSLGADGRAGGEGLGKDLEVRFDAAGTCAPFRRDEGSNVVCTVHDVMMVVTQIPVVDPMGDVFMAPQYYRIRNREFPNARSCIEVLHGAGHLFEKHQRGRFCPACRQQEKKCHHVYGRIREGFDGPDAYEHAWAILENLDLDKEYQRLFPGEARTQTGPAAAHEMPADRRDR